MKPRALDALYFSLRPWAWRVKQWLRRAQADEHPLPFLEGNVELIRGLLGDPDTGVRMVVNLGADALLSFLRDGHYLNIYQRAVIGRAPPEVPPERREVDTLLGIDAPNTYFGALALGGAGVRYYGAWCMVIGRAHMAADTALFDRDSYDLLLPPLTGRSDARRARIVRALRGRWDSDAVDMPILKLLPRLPALQHLITAGSVSRLVMNDQEFVEVQRLGPVRVSDLEELRHASEDAALEAWVRGRSRQGAVASLVEMRWVGQREDVARELRRQRVPQRLVNRASGGEP